MEDYNVVVSISTTVCVSAKDADDAIEKVNEKIRDWNPEMLGKINDAVSYSLRQGHVEVTDAIAPNA